MLSDILGEILGEWYWGGGEIFRKCFFMHSNYLEKYRAIISFRNANVSGTHDVDTFLFFLHFLFFSCSISFFFIFFISQMFYFFFSSFVSFFSCSIFSFIFYFSFFYFLTFYFLHFSALNSILIYFKICFQLILFYIQNY